MISKNMIEYQRRSFNYAFTSVRNENYTQSKEITQCRNSFFPYHEGLFLKERNGPQQIIPFKRSPHLKKKGTQFMRITA